LEKIPFDNFTINIDISGDIRFSTGILLKLLLNNVKNNVHIINYTALDINSIIDDHFSDNMANDSNIEKKIIVAMDTPMNFASVEAYAKNLSVDDYLLIVGGERLMSFSKTTSIIRTEFSGWVGNLHFMDSENWNTLTNEIDKLYGDMQDNLLGIVFNIFMDRSSRDLFLSLTDKSSNFSITCIELVNQNENYEKLQRDIFSKFEGSSLAEIVTMLEKNKDKLDNNTYIYMTALAYMQHGDFSKSIEIFESNYDNLRNEEKLILADLLISINNRERAEEILNELFRLDKYQKGLIQSILRLHNDNDDSSKKREWIEIGMKLDPSNPAILEHYGNWLSNSGDYLGAAKIFREIRDIMDSSPYYELVARVNDLFNSPPKPSVAESYIYSVLEGNPELKNEAKYRLARFMIENKGSLYTAYSVLREIDFEFDKPRVIEIAKLKIRYFRRCC
jgi:tetratricopeptide (TPR) repeat protein